MSLHGARSFSVRSGTYPGDVTGLLYALAVLTPLVLAGTAVAMIWVRWIERRAEDRIRAEHGLPPRRPRPTRAIEDVEGRPAAVQALRRQVAVALEPEAVAGPVPAPAGRLPWPLEDLGELQEIRVSRTPPPAAPAVAPVPEALPGPVRAPEPAADPGPPVIAALPDDDREGARAALARAAATLEELERAADRADRYGTKDCPECSRSVRLSARVCPHCRHRMAPEPDRRDVTAA